jgi:GntR family transcriptional regulator
MEKLNLATDDLHKPIFSQIQEYLAEMILSGELPPETKLPSERELSKQLDISRMTVRRAITELVNEGMLNRRHGSGTYVSRPKITYNARELLNYIDAMQSRGIATGSQLLEFGQIPASRRLAERLAMDIGQPIYRVMVMRLANRIPFVLERSYFPCVRCPNLEEYDLERSSIHDLLTEIYNVKIYKVIQSVEAVLASDIVARQLRVEEGFPLLMISRTLYQKEKNQPVMYAQDFLRSDYARIETEYYSEE